MLREQNTMLFVLFHILPHWARSDASVHGLSEARAPSPSAPSALRTRPNALGESHSTWDNEIEPDKRPKRSHAAKRHPIEGEKTRRAKQTESLGEEFDDKDSARILETGKKLIQRNTELIKNIERGLQNIKSVRSGTDKTESNPETGRASSPSLYTRDNREEVPPPKKTEEKKQTLESHTALESPPKSPLTSASPAAHSMESPVAQGDSSAKPTASGTIHKFSDILFKSALVTKSDVLTKEEAATFVEDNRKMKAMLMQQQKILEGHEKILKKFITNNYEMPNEEEPANKSKDVLKYQVIEVTEAKKK